MCLQPLQSESRFPTLKENAQGVIRHYCGPLCSGLHTMVNAGSMAPLGYLCVIHTLLSWPLCQEESYRDRGGERTPRANTDHTPFSLFSILLPPSSGRMSYLLTHGSEIALGFDLLCLDSQLLVPCRLGFIIRSVLHTITTGVTEGSVGRTKEASACPFQWHSYGLFPVCNPSHFLLNRD